MRVVFAGTPEVALPALEAVADSRHELVGVVTRSGRSGRPGPKAGASPVARRAEELGVPVLKPEHPRDPDFQAALRELPPDCCPVVAYGALLPQSALDIPEHGWVNLHFSVLPAWRGAAPVQHAIWAGDEVTGATTFRIVRELDAGPTYGVMTQTIRPEDTAGDLLHVSPRAAPAARADPRRHRGRHLEAREQPADGSAWRPKIAVEDARVAWAEPAVAVDRRIRACTPEPGAWSTFDGERIKLGRSAWSTPTRTPVHLEPGSRGRQERRARRHRHGARPAGRVQAPVGKEMAAADWARGVRLPPGARLGEWRRA